MSNTFNTRLTVITPTCDRPLGLELAEMFMRRQTRQPDEWIVADGGTIAAPCTMGQIHLHERIPAGPENFVRNLRRGCERATGDVIVLWEDDDHYAPTHLEQLLQQLAPAPIQIAGDPLQRYYNVAHRVWRVWQNRGSSLCQTGFRRSLLPVFQEVLERCLRQNSYGVDAVFWARTDKACQSLEETLTVVGIKGLPGRPGLGLGHRPDRQWNADPDLAHLHMWVGEDVALYAPLYRRPAPVIVPTPAGVKGQPRLVARYFAGEHTPGSAEVWPRLARVLEWTAWQQCQGWQVDVREVPAAPLSVPPRSAAAIAYEHNAQKLDEWTRVIEMAAEGECLALVDADMMILRPLDPIWELAFDLALTVRARGCRSPVNTGVVFVRVSETVRGFFRHWREETRRMLAQSAHHAPWHRKYGGITQAALGFLRETQNADGLLIREVPCQEWNCDESAWAHYSSATRLVHVKSGLRGLIFGHRGPALGSHLQGLAGMWRRLERAALSR